MSSSISLSTFADLETMPSKNLSPQSFMNEQEKLLADRNNNPKMDEICDTGEQSQLPIWPQQSAIYQSQLNKERFKRASKTFEASNRIDTSEGRRDFFEQVDDVVS